MPIYSYKCENTDCELGEQDRTLPIDQYDDPQKCECGVVMKKLVTMPTIHGLSTSIGKNAWGVKPPRDDNKATEKF